MAGLIDGLVRDAVDPGQDGGFQGIDGGVDLIGGGDGVFQAGLEEEDACWYREEGQQADVFSHGWVFCLSDREFGACVALLVICRETIFR